MKKYLLFALPFVLSACSSDMLFPKTGNTIVTNPASEKVVLSSKTGTLVGDRVNTYKNELNGIRGEMNKVSTNLSKVRESALATSKKYYEIIAEMETKLSLGTTPSNPKMVALYNNAQNALQDSDLQSADLNNLVAEVSALGANSGVLAQNIKATYAVPGALDVDHDNLRVLENGTEQTAVSLKNLLNEISADANAQKAFTDNARLQLLRLNDAVARGNFNSAGATVAPAFSAPKAPIARTPLNAPSGKDALVKINFADENVDYIQSLESSVSNALKTNPNTKFLVKAMNPSNKKLSKDEAKKYAAQVFADMIALGVEPQKINLAAGQDSLLTSPHVFVYTR
ncbi:MAG: hypothetical protein IJ870_06235 [Alphaproteobacteria bacterium]|nr:hypothetical protein [Alphaproteobacteria bacterium]